MFKLILLALSDRGDGKAAFQAASSMAVRNNAGFTVLHVSTPLGHEGGCVLQLSNAEEISARRVEIEDMCRAMMPSGLTADVMLSAGFLDVEILKTCRLLEPDLLVVGEQSGADKCRRELTTMGAADTAELTARTAPCPVMAIPAAAKPDTLSGAFQRILIASDLTPGTTGIFKVAEQISAQENAELRAFHVLAADESVSDRTALNCKIEKAKKQLTYLCRNLPVACLTAAREGEPALEILKYMREHDVDLLIMATHCYNANPEEQNGAVAAAVINRARCPVMLVGPAVATINPDVSARTPRGNK
ncbi:Nucleotide-binding universal stress protein, UspA family [Desulfonatronum thiosulfatophilum]|uniref:Nucleotide-binding universal stress protein, UspA family n=1 Tax=Desulfonatronum thiosulfatophilum TaxID=617002 RepID=A0A1G6CXW8_9BACT|nr:universal stress protein [Desulfonatronum thiosulfatophilum]SDB37660.1 Nucleotide-binding universal stress protein, UspA family [Desulfonatronum thiosulfatophilum]